MGYLHTKPDKTKLFFGSARLYVADCVADVATAVLKPLGILAAFSLQTKQNVVTPEGVNGEHDKVVTSESATISLSLQEHNEENIKELTGELTDIELITGAPVTGFQQNLAIGSYPKGQFIPFSQQNYAGGVLQVPSNIVITSDPSGTPVVLVLGTDYDVAQNEFGTFGIIPLNDSVAWDTTKLRRIVFDYTPKSEMVIHQGGKSTIVPKLIMIENQQADGRYIRMYFYKCFYTEGGAPNFKKDNSGELIDFNFTLEAMLDYDRPVGEQLFKRVRSA